MLPAVLAPVVPIGAKVLGVAKGLIGGAKAAGAVKAAAGLGGGAIGPMSAKVAGQVAGIGKGAYLKRMAGQVFGSLAGKAKGGIDVSKMSLEQLRNLKTKDVLNAGYNMSDDAGFLDRVRRGMGSFEGFKKNLGQPLDRDTIATMVAPDLLFGGMAALTTEGDIVDKAIAGTGAAAGGIVGGLGTRGILGPKSQLGIIGSEIAGGMAGDMVGYGVADNIIRMKHGGMTPAEQRFSDQDEQYRAQLLQELKQQYGL